MNAEIQHCRSCGENKPAAEFYIYNHVHCKQCLRDVWRSQHPARAVKLRTPRWTRNLPPGWGWRV